MHKAELIGKLQAFVCANQPQPQKGTWQGQVAYATYLIHYLQKLNIPSDEKYSFYEIEPYLPKILVDAFEELRTAEDHQTHAFRVLYKKELGVDPVNIHDVGTDHINEQSHVIQTTFSFLMDSLIPKKNLINSIQNYCYAQRTVIQQYFDKFIREVYRKGLSEIVSKKHSKTHSVVLGKTKLRLYYSLNGGTWLTFTNNGELTDYVSFVGRDTEDPEGLNIGIESITTDLITALQILQEATENWPKNQQDQVKIVTVEK